MTQMPAPLAAAPVWDELPSAIKVLTPGGDAVHVNQAFSLFTGRPAETILGRGWCDLLTPASRDLVLAQVPNRRDFVLQLDIAGPNGIAGWVDCTACWIESAQHYVCVLHDVSATKRAEQAAQAKAAQFQLLADSVPALIAYYELDGLKCRFANRRYAQAFGLDEQSILGRSFGEIIGKDAEREVRPHVERMLQEAQPVLYERRYQAPVGPPRWFEVSMVPQLNDAGRVIAAFVLVSDITRHRVAEATVRESEERLAKFMQASCEGIVFHQDGLVSDANPPLCALLGYTLDELRGRRVLEFIAPEQGGRAAAVLASGQELTYESVLVHRDGTQIPVELIVRTMMRNDVRMRMTIVRDVRERRAAQARIYHLAHHDPLTGLPNRNAFIERLEHLTASSRASESRLALLFIDLDHFKRVNDSLGHLAGDRLLQTVALRITANLRGTDLVARFGGDEFLVLLPGVGLRSDVEDVARKLLAAIEAPVDADGWSISVSPSIGVALYPLHGSTPSELIKHADAAMYVAKAHGRANFRFFDPSMASSAYSALVMEGELAQAIGRNQFFLEFQPQVRASDGALVTTEALIRWMHPLRGKLHPDEFIPVAEQRRLMLSIGRWVLNEAARHVARWQTTALKGIPVAVNLSTMQFETHDFVEQIAHVLADADLPGHLLELELTERMLMADLPMVETRLAQLKRLGILISVDDFGTGYSSLGHLKDLPIDKVKIDRSFIRDLPDAHDSAAITRAIIQLGQSLGMCVIAEGVETEAQRSFLTDAGCDELQGYLIGEPMDGATLVRWVSQRWPSATDSAPLSR